MREGERERESACILAHARTHARIQAGTPANKCTQKDTDTQTHIQTEKRDRDGAGKGKAEAERAGGGEKGNGETEKRKLSGIYAVKEAVDGDTDGEGREYDGRRGREGRGG